MEEQLSNQPQKQSSFDMDRVNALSRAIWRDFGPLIMGALVLAVVLSGGWYLWQNSKSVENAPVVIEETQELGDTILLPTSEITIPGGLAQSSPTPAPPVSPAPSTSAQAKGGTLPKTGLPLSQILALASLPIAGVLLKKLVK